VWVPIVTSLASLAIALWSVIIATSEPEVLMLMPQSVRLIQGNGAATQVYVQPSFLSTAKNDRIEVISDIRLHVQPLDGGDGRDFIWQEYGQWLPDPVYDDLEFEYVGDSGPLLVSPSNAQQPVAIFRTDPAWTFSEGSYRLTITASRVVSSAPLQGSFTISPTARDIEFINAKRDNYITVEVNR
jgi:hypothetical protein